ncbi:Fungal-trans domain-containing protein [Mycena chlorophos]|uniref:Fungal-trans domain-containing protein n=1 Tax=Mycena chlorophos TaxID=658473 RepID=A0A8H6TKC9_MYCCL|nr:Fungal-trans domain-containing protein [Mycena chlorophos]
MLENSPESSDEERDGVSANGRSTKRKLGLRCDASPENGDRCSNCAIRDDACTFLQTVKRVRVHLTKNLPFYLNFSETPTSARVCSFHLASPQQNLTVRSKAYIASLEDENRLLRARLASAELVVQSLGTPPAQSPPSSSPETTRGINPLASSLFMMRQSLFTQIMRPPPAAPEDLQHIELMEKFATMHLGRPADRSQGPGRRFVGKSSNIAVIGSVLSLRADVHAPEKKGQFAASLQSMRSQFWQRKQWDNTSIRTRRLKFPPLPLMQELVDLYFQHVGIYLPLLHRPTFERNIREGLFLENDSFGATVLLVCAIAARWHPDPKMGAPDGSGLGTDSYGAAPVSRSDPPLTVPDPAIDITGPNNIAIKEAAKLAAASGAAGAGIAAGWAWFEQVAPDAKHLYQQPGLYDLQYYSLACQYLEHMSSPHICWNLIGLALRLAQDLGIHRRTKHDQQISVEREQCKRVLWVLLYQDRMVSSGMGRPCTLGYEDLDIDLPVECDDEYWEHPTHPFQQPPGIPSRIAFFNALMGLNNMLAASMRSVYGLGKFKSILNQFGGNWEESVIAELDSALNTWRDRLPLHLRWDPDKLTKPIFFDQAAALQCAFYHMEIFIHRPFIPIVRSAPTALPALAICTNAARLCASTADLQRRRKDDVPVVFNFYAIFSSATILLLNIWSSKRAGLEANTARDMGYVNRCMKAIKNCEDSWLHAGMLWDMLVELSSSGHGPTMGPAPQASGSNADTDDPCSNAFTTVHSSPLEGSSTNSDRSPNANFSTSPDIERLGPEVTDIDMLLDMDEETMAMWANAPNGLEVEDWTQDDRAHHSLVNIQTRTALRSARVASLESQLEDANEKIKQLRAELAASQTQAQNSASSPAPSSALDSSLSMLRTSLQALIRPPSPPELSDELDHGTIVDRLRQLHLGMQKDVRFVGKSSGFALVYAAFDLKAHVSDQKPGLNNPRMKYWKAEPWTHISRRTHALRFPPMPLMRELVDLFFTHTNIYLPILHRPTFEREMEALLFMRDDAFAANLLLVCAIGSRWHPDPMMGAAGPGGTGLGDDEVYGRGFVSPPPSSSSSHSTHSESDNTSEAAIDCPVGLSCGWAWFSQVPPDTKHIFDRPTLYDLQYYPLAVQFLERAATPHISWNLIGAAMRLMQDVGLHRRGPEDRLPSAERELAKRAFWVLMHHDRLLSTGMGRPCGLQFEDYDVDLPIECDDEYWDDPIRPFQQPPGIPSRITFFNKLTELYNILAASSKLVYSLSKAKKIHLGYGDHWEETVVAELDSALNVWRDSVPEHLKWDAQHAGSDLVFFDQSAALQCAFYYVEIFIHRPFIPMIRERPTEFPSLAICTQAARGCANVVDLQRIRHGDDVPIIFNFHNILSSAIILLLNIWTAKRAGNAAEVARELPHVYKCMSAIKICEGRWNRAGMLWDVLNELASVGQSQVPRKNGPDEPRGAAMMFSVPPYAASPSQADPDGAHRNQAAVDIDMLLEMDPQTMALWANAPSGFEVEDWGQYFHGWDGAGRGADWQ